MARLPTSTPSGATASDLMLGALPESSVRFGTPIPGPEGPAGTNGAATVVAMSIPGVLIAGTGVMPLIIPRDMTVLGIIPGAFVPPVGADIIYDVLRNGVTLFTTSSERPRVPAGSQSGPRTVPDVVDLLEGDVITVDVIQVGTTPGAHGSLTMEVV